MINIPIIYLPILSGSYVRWHFQIREDMGIQNELIWWGKTYNKPELTDFSLCPKRRFVRKLVKGETWVDFPPGYGILFFQWQLY